MCFTKCSSKCCKIYRKTRVPESVFNKVKLATLLKKRLWHRRFPVNFSKLVRPTFLWNISGWVLLNADYWKTPRDYWSKISFFSPLRFLILKNSILMELFMRCKTLSSSFLLKSERFHQSSQKFLLCYQCFSCLIIVGKVVNLLITFAICMIFFHVRFMSFWHWLK